ncbi:MAG: hypothetical protein ACXAC7_12395 [Candidatus Hodarchaeales archaeon]
MILQESGLPLFTSSFEKGIVCCSKEHKTHTQIMDKSLLLSGFLVAIRSLASEFGGNLKQLKLGEWDVYLQELGEIVTILLSNPTENMTEIKEYQQKVKSISELFLNQYKMDLKHWSGDPEMFKGFMSILEKNQLVEPDVVQEDLCQDCISNSHNSNC